jgi:hypothetical protein
MCPVGLCRLPSCTPASPTGSSGTTCPALPAGMSVMVMPNAAKDAHQIPSAAYQRCASTAAKHNLRDVDRLLPSLTPLEGAWRTRRRRGGTPSRSSTTSPSGRSKAASSRDGSEFLILVNLITRSITRSRHLSLSSLGSARQARWMEPWVHQPFPAPGRDDLMHIYTLTAFYLMPIGPCQATSLLSGGCTESCVYALTPQGDGVPGLDDGAGPGASGGERAAHPADDRLQVRTPIIIIIIIIIVIIVIIIIIIMHCPCDLFVCLPLEDSSLVTGGVSAGGPTRRASRWASRAPGTPPTTTPSPSGAAHAPPCMHHQVNSLARPFRQTPLMPH